MYIYIYTHMHIYIYTHPLPTLCQVRFTVALPAQGRTVMGRWAASVLTETLPTLAMGAMLYGSYAAPDVKRHLDSVEDQAAARAQLAGWI